MKQPLISVIVPVYNAENYVARCVDSLLAQTLKEFEIIMVNDGSTDASGTICDDYARKDNRIRVVHQTNGGVAAARQRGIDNALGIYSIHADPDDWVAPTMLEELYAKATSNDADMVICDVFVDYENDTKYSSQGVDSCTAESYLEQLMYGKIHGSLCNKLIRTELYSKYGIRFIDGINHCEDYLICVRLFLRGIKVAYLPKAFYHYDQVVNNNSITRRYTRHTLDMRLRFVDILKGLVGRRNKALSHVITGVAMECYYYNILSSREFAKTFRRYRLDFLLSKHEFKLRVFYVRKTSFACFKSRKAKKPILILQ